MRLISKDEMSGTIRTFGNGGIFGYSGQFYIPNIGFTRFYTRQSRNYVLVITKQNKKWVLSPDDTGLAEKITRNCNNGLQQIKICTF